MRPAPGLWVLPCASLSTARRGCCHRCCLPLPGAEGVVPSSTLIPVRPAWTRALQLSAEPYCLPVGVRHRCHWKVASGSSQGSRTSVMRTGELGEPSLYAPASRAVAQSPPNYSPYSVWQPGENSRTLYLLVQICLPAVWLQGRACLGGPREMGACSRPRGRGPRPSASSRPALPVQSVRTKPQLLREPWIRSRTQRRKLW